MYTGREAAFFLYYGKRKVVQKPGYERLCFSAFCMQGGSKGWDLPGGSKRKEGAGKVAMVCAFAPGKYSRQEAVYSFLRKQWKNPGLAERIQKASGGQEVLEQLKINSYDHL